MPNDTGAQFPSPPQEVNLTDDVAPDLSVPTLEPAPIPAEPPPPPTPAETTPEPPVKPEPNPAPIPATFTPRRPFPLLTVVLIFIAIAATAATYFFYQQTQGLNQQLTQLQQTLDRQKIQTTPTPEETFTPTPESTISASPTLPPTGTVNTRSAFGQISAVIAVAQKQYPSAQLLMITGTDVHSDNQIVLKYWFRQNETDKKYLYVLKEVGKDFSLVDQQVYVSPDDNIPSLNQLAANGQLGLDLPQAYVIAYNLCPTNYDCAAASASAQYLKANNTLWQISFKAPSSSKPFVVQIDSTNSKILYKSQ